MRFYWPIAKLDREQRMVWGYASTEAQDEQGETVTREALAAALGDYMRFANIREMHQPSAVGVAQEAAIDDRGLYLGAKIVDPEAWAKVTAGVYKGFSIGGRVTARDPVDRTVITGLSLTEISVVDRPANPEAVFDCWKRAVTTPPAPRAAADPHDAPVAGYADPGYQPDAKPRYPLDTERHIRAAWAFIHMPHNAARYAPGQLAQVKAKIVAAWRAHIDRAGPPAAAGTTDTTRKNLAFVERLQCIVTDLCDIIDALHEEALPLDGGEPAPDLIRELGGGDAAAFVRMSERHLHPHPVPPPSSGRAIAFDTSVLAKLADAILPRLDALQRRVEDIAQTPLPPQTAARGFAGLAKRDDSTFGLPPAPDDIVASLARMSDEERTLTLIKAAHAAPIRR